MPGKHERQQLAYEFLKTKGFNEPFPMSEIDAAAGWKNGGAYTNITKYWQGWMRHSGDQVEILPEFRRVTLEQFIKQSSQKRRTYATFEPTTFDFVAIFEFLLPLTRETQLRTALDDLFFKESLQQRFQEIGTVKLGKIIPTKAGESAVDYEQRLLDLVEDWFGGYSIQHVAGRFRMGALRTRLEAASEHALGNAYLADETTAVVTFIVPLKGVRSPEVSLPLDVTEQVLAVRGLFEELFVKAVIRSVEGEEVVWFLEDSPLGRKLHVFEKSQH